MDEVKMLSLISESHEALSEARDQRWRWHWGAPHSSSSGYLYHSGGAGHRERHDRENALVFYPLFV